MSKSEYNTVNETAANNNVTVTQQKLARNDGTQITVICLAHNDEKSIANTIESIINQKTVLKYKVFIGVDKSNDNTVNIVMDYARKYDIITPFIHNELIGDGKNFAYMISEAVTPYIAICRACDYWSDEEKLQKQYDYMQENEEIAFCLTSSEILPTDQIDLSMCYNAIDDKYLLPESEPGYQKKQKYTPSEIINSKTPECISTFFGKWDYDIELPDWFFTKEISEPALYLLQMKDGEAGYMNDITTRCGRCSMHIIRNYPDRNEYYIYQTLKKLNWMSGILNVSQIYNWQYPNGLLINKIKEEASIYLNKTLNQLDDYDSAIRLFKECPLAGDLVFKYYIGADQDRRNLERTLGWNGYTTLIRRKKSRKFLKKYATLANFCLKIKRSKFVTGAKNAIKNFAQFCCYWYYTPRKKSKNIWVISGFPKTTYMDNTKYFYEYVTNNHPEIEIYWLTMSKVIYNQLKSNGYKVCLFRTKECRKILSRASVGIVDHYACADFDRFSGYNDKIKIVNLWHGVGFKPAGDENGPKWTNQRGLRRSTDILPQPSDNFLVKICKKIKYFFHAYYRELFEKYLMFVCPGQERIEMVGKIWGIPESCYFMSGHPRNEPLYQTEVNREHPLIMYAPTYRETPENEMKMVNDCLYAVNDIQALMEKIDGKFAIRLHPHTWRNYKGKILSAIRYCDRIFLDTEKDVYTYLAEYSVMISDYSSIALDFAMLDGPTIFLCADLNDSERGFNLDFPNVVPGPIFMNWQDTLKKVEEYVKKPELDRTLRQEKCKYFFAPEVNDINNSKRIVDEIKRRIKM